MGYPRKTLGYYFYYYEKGKVFVAWNDVFLKKEFLGRKDSRSPVRLEEVWEEQARSDLTATLEV